MITQYPSSLIETSASLPLVPLVPAALVSVFSPSIYQYPSSPIVISGVCPSAPVAGVSVFSPLITQYPSSIVIVASFPSTPLVPLVPAALTPVSVSPIHQFPLVPINGVLPSSPFLPSSPLGPVSPCLP